MTTTEPRRVGFACAYTPLPLLRAAGFEPYRILPLSAAPDQAGAWLHDNLCPHVKRLLDRALGADLPPLEGLVFVLSCDAMRRLVDAWAVARPADRLAVVDLPVSRDRRSVAWFAAELGRLAETLAAWSGRTPDGPGIVEQTAAYNRLADGLAELAKRCRLQAGGPAAWQREANAAVTTSLPTSLARVERLLSGECRQDRPGGPTVLLFGNVLPDPEALEVFARAGCRVAADDLCTGGRQLVPLTVDDPERALEQLAAGLLARPACGRTFRAERPAALGEEVLARARQAGASGVVAHVLKFCDPYLSRLPAVRRVLREAGLPLLVLEGDCSLQSIGQQRTRIEAFVEMLEGPRP